MVVLKYDFWLVNQILFNLVENDKVFNVNSLEMKIINIIFPNIGG